MVLLFDIDKILFVVVLFGFDFMSLDNMLDMLFVGGMDLFCVMCLLILLVW